MYEPETATIGTQVWKYRPIDMFDDMPASDYEHGTTSEMEQRWSEIRNAYQSAGYTIENFRTNYNSVKDESTGRKFTQVHKSFGVLDVPLKCLNGKKAKELVVNLWINK